MPQAGIRTRTAQYRLLERLRDGGQERMPDNLDWGLLNPFQFTVHWTRAGHTSVVRHYDIVRWRERNKYSTEATKRINAYARLQYEAADAEWNRDWPARPS